MATILLALETVRVDLRSPGGALKDTSFGTATGWGAVEVLFHHPFDWVAEGSASR